MEDGYSSDLELDRVDVNGNYCKENCRWTTGGEQAYNQRRSSKNSSGRTGVSFYTSRCQWEAYISFNNEFIKLGYFNSFEDACKAREEAELKYYGYTKE
ncbi:AP2 domain protein [compost metagenome]